MIGIDIVSIARISRLRRRFGELFLQRFLSQDEIALAKIDATLAGFWAAKEAASKALGCGICAKCGFLDIKISKTAKNAPLLDFSDEIKTRFNIQNAQLSITHDEGIAAAIVVLNLK